MTQTLITVSTTKLLSVTAQRISTLRITRSHNCSPFPPAEDASTLQPVNEFAVHGREKTSDDSQGRVLRVGPRLAAIRPLCGALQLMTGGRG